MLVTFILEPRIWRSFPSFAILKDLPKTMNQSTFFWILWKRSTNHILQPTPHLGPPTRDHAPLLQILCLLRAVTDLRAPGQVWVEKWEWGGGAGRRKSAWKQWCVRAWLSRESCMRPDRDGSRECRQFASSPDQKRREREREREWEREKRECPKLLSCASTFQHDWHLLVAFVFVPELEGRG